jgi:hypothetical protein
MPRRARNGGQSSIEPQNLKFSRNIPDSTTTLFKSVLTMDRQNPAASASQETLASLQLVDPTPLPDSRPGSISIPPPDRSDLPARSSTFSFLGLSGSGGHSSVYYCWSPSNQP